MKTKTMLTAMALVIAMNFFACKGDTGAAGPAGANGTANISNTSFTVTGWANYQTDWFDVTLQVSAITNDNQDLVEVYALASNGDWFVLPQTDFLEAGDNMTFDFITGQTSVVNVIYENPNNTSPGDMNFRVVVIPPTQVAKMKLNKVNLKDYNQVNAYIKLNSK